MKVFFARRFARYFLGMLIPTFLVFSVSFFLFIKSVDRIIIEEGKQTVRAVKTNFELVISNILYQNDLLSNTTRMSIALDKLLSQSDMSYSDSIYISSLRSTLSSITSAHDYVDSIYFYLDSREYFLSSRSGSENLSLSSDTSWLDIYRSMEPDEQKTVVRRKQNSLIDHMETLSVFQRILLQRGCIVVNLNIKRMQQMLDSMRSNSHEIIFILDKDGDILLEESTFEPENNLQKSFKDLIAQHDGDIDTAFNSKNGVWFRANGRRYLLSTGKNNEENLYILSAISNRAQSNIILSALKTYVLVILGDFLMILFLAYHNTRRTFDQIHYINNVFENAENGIFTDYEVPQANDEYSLVLNRIIHLYVNKAHLHSQLREKEYEREVTELKALQLQINPHFLFNTLQTLDLEMRRNISENAGACSIIGDLSDILKYTLRNSQEWVSLSNEILYLKKYIEIQRFRFGDQFIIYYELDEGVEEAEVFKLMFQPLVENSLRYGIRDPEKKCYIEIRIIKDNDDLCCTVSDNGTGMDETTLRNLRSRINDKKSENIGLVNVNQRLILRYGDSAGLRIDSASETGTCISFRIPHRTIIDEGIIKYQKNNN